MNPGGHGVSTSSSAIDRVRRPILPTWMRRATLLESLSAQGHEVRAGNIPVTYPPFPVNGRLIAGGAVPPGGAVRLSPAWADTLAREAPFNGMEWTRYRDDPLPLIDEAQRYILERTASFSELLKGRGGSRPVSSWQRTDSDIPSPTSTFRRTPPSRTVVRAGRRGTSSNVPDTRCGCPAGSPAGRGRRRRHGPDLGPRLRAEDPGGRSRRDPRRAGIGRGRSDRQRRSSHQTIAGARSRRLEPTGAVDPGRIQDPTSGRPLRSPSYCSVTGGGVSLDLGDGAGRHRGASAFDRVRGEMPGWSRFRRPRARVADPRGAALRGGLPWPLRTTGTRPDRDPERPLGARSHQPCRHGTRVSDR